ncbi:hypothetical protein PPMP20_04190 [Paraburkholderia phymatum]|nr:hypothetical protein [Paraburkholderia phymatum]
MINLIRLGDTNDHCGKIIIPSGCARVVGTNELEGKEKYGQGTRM